MHPRHLMLILLIMILYGSSYPVGKLGINTIPPLLFTALRVGLIFLAFLRLRKQDFDGTQKWLMRISNVERNLVRKQQGYFNYLLGIIHSQKNLTQSEKYFKAALKVGLSMNHDIAMAKMSLAGIYLQKRRKREAQILLSEAKKLDKHGMLTGQMKMIQKQMKRI